MRAETWKDDHRAEQVQSIPRRKANERKVIEVYVEKRLYELQNIAFSSETSERLWALRLITSL